MIFRLIKKNNKVSFPWEKFKQWIEDCKDGIYNIGIEKLRAKRSNSQNNTYHWWTRIVADWEGELEPEKTCENLKVRLGYCTKKMSKLGVEKWDCPSTRNFNVPDMSVYMMKVEALMADLTDGNMKLPSNKEPNPYE